MRVSPTANRSWGFPALNKMVTSVVTICGEQRLCEPFPWRYSGEDGIPGCSNKQLLSPPQSDHTGVGLRPVQPCPASIPERTGARYSLSLLSGIQSSCGQEGRKAASLLHSWAGIRNLIYSYTSLFPNTNRAISFLSIITFAAVIVIA